MATTVTLATADGDMGLYDVEPDGEARGAVVVVQEAFGVNHHIEAVTRRFAAAGYRAVAPHLFHRTGDPVLGYGDFDKLMPHFQGLSEEGLLNDVDAALGYLHEAGFGPSRTGVVGFCMGGTVAFLVAVRRGVGAAVTFYGGGIAEGRFGMASQLDLAADLQAPWLGLYGDEDKGIPVEDVEKLRAAVAAAPVDTDIVRYPEAGHGFHCDARPDYKQDAATDAWQRTLAWFGAHLATS
ncbi:MAG TPA: dienelactone hydrolase family protein [Acidimicrobiales bacterium]|nr:dienelactone hydrolase family protein [Acidimicrobiales bacterium]